MPRPHVTGGQELLNSKIKKERGAVMKNFFSKIKKPLIIVILGGLIVGYFFYLTNRKIDNNDKMADNSPLSQVLDKDLTLNYPGTPRGVLIYYSDILKVLYTLDGKKDEADVRRLGDKLLGIFDEELISYNPPEIYKASLVEEVKVYNSAKKKVADYVIEGNSNIEFLKDKGKEYAIIDVAYFVHEDKKVIKTMEKFTLRKDSEGKWKILFWEIGKVSDMEG